MDHGKEQMLNGNIFISHLFCFIFCTDQHFVQLLTDENLSSGNFNPFCKILLCCIHKQIFIDLHLFYQFQDQSIILFQQCHKQMLLLNLLIAIFICKFLTVLNCLYGFLCKFLNIHKAALLSGA